MENVGAMMDVVLKQVERNPVAAVAVRLTFDLAFEQPIQGNFV